MAKQPSEGKWLLFKNTKKRDDAPDYIGELMFNGELRGMVGYIDKVNNNPFIYGHSYLLEDIDGDQWGFKMLENVKHRVSHPDFRGEITINGVVKDIVAWLRLDKYDEQFLSGSINPKKVTDLESGDVDGNKY